jgi:hypothetical protein
LLGIRHNLPRKEVCIKPGVVHIDRYERDPAAWMRLTDAIDNLTNPRGATP